MDCGHHWTFEPRSRRYAPAWPRLIADTTTILAAAVLGITVAGLNGTGSWLADIYRGIALRGGPGTDVLRLPAPCRNHTRHCAAYDLAGTGVILRAHLLLGHDFAIRSSGDCESQWLHGIRKRPPRRPHPHRGPVRRRNPYITAVLAASTHHYQPPDTRRMPCPTPHLQEEDPCRS